MYIKDMQCETEHQGNMHCTFCIELTHTSLGNSYNFTNINPTREHVSNFFMKTKCGFMKCTMEVSSRLSTWVFPLAMKMLIKFLWYFLGTCLHHVIFLGHNTQKVEEIA